MQPNPTTDDQPQQPPSPIRVCKRPDCGKKLQSNNTTGYCHRHRRLYRPKGKSKIIVPYKEGLSLADVAALHHVSVNEVRRVINEAGLMRLKADGIRLAKRGRSPDAAVMWMRVKLRIIERKSIQEIAKQLKLTPEGINYSFHRMGWPVTACHSFGEVFDRPELRRLKEMSGLEVPQLAQELGMHVGTLKGLLSTRRPDDELSFDTARKIVEWRNRVFFCLLAKGARHSGHGRHSRQSIILAFFPKLGQRYQFLMLVLRSLAKPLPKNLQWEGQHELQGHLIDQAMREEAEEKAGRSPGNLFRRFLPWAPELMPFLAEKLQDLRGVHHQELAWEIMAGSLRTKGPVLRGLDAPSRVRRTKRISAVDMSGLIFKAKLAEAEAAKTATSSTSRRPSQKAAHRKKDVSDTRHSEIGLRVENELPLFARLFKLKNKSLNQLREKLFKEGASQAHYEAVVISRNAQSAARRYVAESSSPSLSVGSVGTYHRQFLRERQGATVSSSRAS